ncbi:MAG: class I SAM-dependent methyltransferase [Candidatus Omnitrophota bacterium]
MRVKKDDSIDKITKKAWENNWENISISEIMEIFEYPRVKQHLDIYLKYLPKDKKIIEGGCGLGPYLIKLKELGYDVVGVDYNKEPLDKIREYDPDIPLFCSDIQVLPFSNEYFGGYLSLGVIEHFTEGPERSIKEARRVLGKGGYFIVKVPQSSIFEKISYPFILLKKNKIIRRMFGKNPKEIYWEQHFKVRELSGMIKKNGFDIVEMIPIDHEHALMSFCGVFRDKNKYDGANEAGVAVSKICQRYLPWLTAAEVIYVCRKK